MIFLKIPLWRQALRGLGALLCNLIYSLISLLFQVFVTVAQAPLFSDTEIAPIYQRVTLILTIFMTFYITFEFIKYTIDPDTFSDKEKGVGNMMYKIVLVIILIAMVPRIFTIAYDIQARIINTNVIGRIILGKTENNYAREGYNFSANMLEQFYYIDEDVCGQGGKNCSGTTNKVNNNLQKIRNTGVVNILPGITSPDTIGTGDDPYIYFDGFMAIIVGGFIGYILVIYSIDLGARYAQLLYLQVIAPIAIMGYLLPQKEGIFQKWMKQCLTTFIDVFIRLSLIYFILLLVNLIKDKMDNGNLFVKVQGAGPAVTVLAYTAIVMGLLMFAQKAPKLLQQLFPSLGGEGGLGFGLSAKERFEPGMNAVGLGRRVAGGVGGFVAGGIAGKSLRAAIAGGKAGANKDTKGLFAGSAFSRIKNAAYAGGKVRQQREDIRAAGGRPFQAEHRQGHWQNVAQEQDRRVNNLDNLVNKKKAVGTAIEGIKFRKQMDSMDAAIAQHSPEAAKEWTKVKKDAEKFARQYADGKITAAQMETAITNRVNAFQSSTGLTVPAFDTKDFEFDSSKWGNVKSAIDEAKKAAQEVKDEKYTDRDGVEHTLGYTEATFAEELGTYADNAETSRDQFKASDEYKDAHANAKGAEGNSK